MQPIAFNVNLGPYIWIEQRMSHGRTRLVKCFSRESHGPVPVLRDGTKQLKVRFVRGGKMFAGFVPKKAEARRSVQHFNRRPAAAASLGGMLRDLTAIEQTNRVRALEAARSGR